MANDKMFLKAFIDRDAGVSAPRVAPVEFQVRTGVSIPAKPDMHKNELVMVTWRYQVKDTAAFKARLKNDEVPLTGPAFKGSAKLNKWLYHGTYAVTSKAQPAGTFETIWSTNKANVSGLKAVLTGPKPAAGTLEASVVKFVSDLRTASTLAAGQDFPEEILDPTSDD